MTTTAAELGSIVTQIGDLADRLSRAGDDFNRTPTEDVATALYEAERALRTAVRSTERAANAM